MVMRINRSVFFRPCQDSLRFLPLVPTGESPSYDLSPFGLGWSGGKDFRRILIFCVNKRASRNVLIWLNARIIETSRTPGAGRRQAVVQGSQLGAFEVLLSLKPPMIPILPIFYYSTIPAMAGPLRAEHAKRTQFPAAPGGTGPDGRGTRDKRAKRSQFLRSAMAPEDEMCKTNPISGQPDPGNAGLCETKPIRAGRDPA